MKSWDLRTLGGLISRSFTLRSFLVIILLVGGLTIKTAVIHVKNPSQPAEEETPLARGQFIELQEDESEMETEQRLAPLPEIEATNVTEPIPDSEIATIPEFEVETESETEVARESGTEPAWIMTSKLSVNVANETPVVNITSQDFNGLPGLAKAIERVFEEEMMKKRGIPVTPSDRIRKIPREQGIAIVRFLEGEMTPEKTTYSFFVMYAGEVYSIYIQFIKQPQITS